MSSRLSAVAGATTDVGAVAIVSVVAIAVVRFVIEAPGLIVFGLAVAAALGWCAWLERHPGSSDSDGDGESIETADDGSRTRPTGHARIRKL
jgi:hypothetical protein